MSNTPPAKILMDNDYQSYGFNWTMKSSGKSLSIPYILIGALEVAFVAILETIVSAILGQQKKCRFTGRKEEGEDDASLAMEYVDNQEAGNVKKGKKEKDEGSTETAEGSGSASETASETRYETAIAAANSEGQEGLKEEPLPPIPAFEPTNEMFGLGLANFTSGFCGGLPCTGVLLRTEVNAETGAESKSSQWFNAVIVAIVSVGLLKYFAYLPFFCIAAMLVRSAIGLSLGAQRCWKEELMPAYRKENPTPREAYIAKFDVANFLAVFAICLFLDGAVGLMVGFVGKYVVYKVAPAPPAKKLTDLSAQ